MDKILNQYGLGILEIRKENFLISWDNLFEEEKGLNEFRICLGEIVTNVFLEENYAHLTDEDKLTDEDYLIDYQYFKDNKVLPIENSSLTFSVFSEDEEIDENYVHTYIQNYFKITLRNYFEKNVYVDSHNYTPFDEIDLFKQLLYNRNVFINNDNLELIKKIDYRIYKDFKFIYELNSHLGETIARDLIREIVGFKIETL